MTAPIVGVAEKLWEDWNIRVCILLSLFIQCCLTFLAPWRKRNKKMSFVIWILYLLADAIALYTIGLISNSSSSTTTDVILVFWSPFLLLHLGGPDTITALALEDNELWLRHLLQLGTQSAGTIYLFYRVFKTKSGVELLIPSVIMYINGCVKYLERTTSLYLASMDTYRESLTGEPDAGPNYAALMEEYASRKAANIPVEIKSNLETAQRSSSSRTSRGNKGPSHHTVAHGSSHSQTLQTNESSSQTDAGDCEQGCIEQIEMNLVKQAHDFYLKFRGLIADTMYSFKERTESRQFFLDKQKKQISGVQAFKMIQIELNFIYDMFFTKVHTLQRGRGITRIFSIVSIIAAFLLFFRHSHKYKKRDMYITYVLLGGAIIMEVIAVIMLSFSDWAVVDSAKRRCRVPFSTILLGFWLNHGPRRWSEEVSQYDLLYHCLNDQTTLINLIPVKSVKKVAESFLYISTNDYDNELADLIFVELKRIAEAANEPKDIKKACQARGNLVFHEEFANISKSLRAWTIDADYDESLLLWHIATNLCVLESFQRNKDNSTGSSLSKSCLEYRKYSKMLGNYMMFLLIMKPSITSSVAGIAQVRFQDTCEEAKKFIRRKLPREDVRRLAKVKRFFLLLGRFLLLLLCAVRDLGLRYCCKNTSEAEGTVKTELYEKRLISLCRRMLDVNTEKKPTEVKGDRSQSVMFDACRLAKELIKIGQRDGEETQWKVTFKVWVELMCYAASRSKPTAHVAQLREGGELITLVWLLMAHLGLGEQFRINKGTGWATLIVRK